MTTSSIYWPPGSHIEISGPHGGGRRFRVDLVRGDTHKRVCQATWSDYGDAILSAGAVERPGLPVLDAVADPSMPRFDTRGRP